jgi:acetylcholinesterase
LTLSFFQSPQPPKRWEGERDATKSNPDNVSRHPDILTNTLIGSEDCLYLNVHTPNLPIEDTFQPLPVLLYIHGGGFVFANGTNRQDNGPDFLIEHNVIVVTINYRLNVFGFLSLEIPEAAGNMGLKDQVQALKWVKENIKAFGGDENNVTVIGLSAGAASVEYLILSEQSKNLFSKAIIQSGSSLNPWALNSNIVELSVKLALNIGYEGSVNDMKAIHTFLMEQPTDLLVMQGFKTVSELGGNGGLNFGFVPSIEKDFKNGDAFLTEHPYITLKAGSFNKVPAIRGFCEFEGLINTMTTPLDVKKLTESKKFMEFCSYPLNDKNKEHYENMFHKVYLDGKNTEEEIEGAIIDFFSHREFSYGVITSTKLAASHEVPSYLYMFAYDSPNSFLKTLFKFGKRGTCHGDDLKFIIKTDRSNIISDEHYVEMDDLISKKICTMWTNFAKYG